MPDRLILALVAVVVGLVVSVVLIRRGYAQKKIDEIAGIWGIEPGRWKAPHPVVICVLTLFSIIHLVILFSESQHSSAWSVALHERSLRVLSDQIQQLCSLRMFRLKVEHQPPLLDGFAVAASFFEGVGEFQVQ